MNFFLYVCMCCMLPMKALDTLELKLEAVLGTKLWSSARTTKALNH